MGTSTQFVRTLRPKRGVSSKILCVHLERIPVRNAKVRPRCNLAWCRPTSICVSASFFKVNSLIAFGTNVFESWAFFSLVSFTTTWAVQYSIVFNYYHRIKCFDIFKAFSCLLLPSSVWRHLNIDTYTGIDESAYYNISSFFIHFLSFYLFFTKWTSDCFFFFLFLIWRDVISLFRHSEIAFSRVKLSLL